jgi:hypothetical protein
MRVICGVAMVYDYEIRFGFAMITGEAWPRNSGNVFRFVGCNHTELSEIRHGYRSRFETVCPHDIQLTSSDHDLLI